MPDWNARRIPGQVIVNAPKPTMVNVNQPDVNHSEVAIELMEYSYGTTWDWVFDLERAAAYLALIDPNFHPAVADPGVKATKRVHRGACDGLSRADIETRAMLSADDVAADLSPALKRKIEMGATILHGINVRIDPEDQNGPTSDRERAMFAIGNVFEGTNVQIGRHIFGAPAL